MLAGYCSRRSSRCRCRLCLPMPLAPRQRHCFAGRVSLSSLPMACTPSHRSGRQQTERHAPRLGADLPGGAVASAGDDRGLLGRRPGHRHNQRLARRVPRPDRLCIRDPSEWCNTLSSSRRSLRFHAADCAIFSAFCSLTKAHCDRSLRTPTKTRSPRSLRSSARRTKS